MSNIYTNVPMFNAQYYLDNNPDLVAAGYTVETVGEHYFEFGAAETLEGGGRVGPNAWFDIQFYREMNPDLEGLAAGDLLLHFATYGAREGRNPNPEFGDGQSINANLFLNYALANPDVAEAYGIPADATRLTDEQQANVAYQFFAWGVNEEREGGIASVPLVPVSLEELLGQYSDALAAVSTAEQGVADANAAKEDAATAFAEENEINAVGGTVLAEGFDEVTAALEAATQAATTTLITGTSTIGPGGLLPAELAELTPEEQQLAINSAQGVLQSIINSNQQIVNSSDQDDLAIAKPLIDAQNVYEEATASLTTLNTAFTTEYSAIGAITGEGNTFAVTSPAPASTPLIVVINGELTATAAGNGLANIDAILASAQDVYDAQEDVATASQLVATAAVDTIKAEDSAALFTFWDTSLAPAAVAPVPNGAQFTLVPDTTTATDLTLAFVDANGNKHLVFVDGTDGAGAAAVGSETGGTVIVDLSPSFDYADITTIASTSASASVDLSALATNAAYTALVNAQNDLADFNEAVTEWEAVVQEQTDFETAMAAEDDAIQAAQDALTQAQADLATAKAAAEAAAGDDVNIVEANEDGDFVATDGVVDLFVFGDEELTITNFGNGEDKIFVNGDYKLTFVDSAADIRANADETALEIFVYEENGNTVLSVEENAISGSVAGSTELTNIILTGTTGEVSMDGDFIVVA